MKGILSVKGSEERMVFQGVHMLFDSQPGELWGFNLDTIGWFLLDESSTRII